MRLCLHTGPKSRPPILCMLGSTRSLKSRTCRSARCVRNHCMTKPNGWHAAPTSVWRSCNVLPSLNVAQSAACGRQIFFSLCLDYICCCSCPSDLKCHSRIAVVDRKISRYTLVSNYALISLHKMSLLVYPSPDFGFRSFGSLCARTMKLLLEFPSFREYCSLIR
jgi:hypothetical protein